MKFSKPFQLYAKRIKDQIAIFNYTARNSAANIDEIVDKILNELVAEKVIVNNPASCGDSLFIVQNCLAEKEKVLRKYTIKSIDTIIPQKLKNNSRDENKGNTEQKQTEDRDRALNSYEALMVKITELKGFLIEGLYTVNKHSTDLSSRIDSGKYHKEIATLWEDCASENYIIKIFVEDWSKYRNYFYKTKKTRIQATLT